MRSPTHALSGPALYDGAAIGAGIGASIEAGIGTDYYDNFNGADKCQENLYIKFTVIPYSELGAIVDSEMTISAEVGLVFGQDGSMGLSSEIGSGVSAENMDSEITPDIGPTNYSTISSQLSAKDPELDPYLVLKIRTRGY